MDDDADERDVTLDPAFNPSLDWCESGSPRSSLPISMLQPTQNRRGRRRRDIDPRSLIPAELLQPLDDALAWYGELKVDGPNLPSVRKLLTERIPAISSRNIQRRTIPGPTGGPDVVVYLINASSTARRRPAILHIHGGGYVFGSALENIPELERFAQQLDCVVVTVEYRLAPETPFPGALDDNYAALKWLHDSAAELGIDTKRIAVMGESAGGGHAALLAIAVRDRKEFTLAAQILIYPMLDDRTASSRSVAPHIGTFIWTRSFNRFGWSALLGQPAGGGTVPYGSVPGRLSDLEGLPPTFIGTGSIDLFVEEDIDYAARLLRAGVPVELLVVPGAYHSFDTFAPDTNVTRSFKVAQLAALRRAFS